MKRPSIRTWVIVGTLVALSALAQLDLGLVDRIEHPGLQRRLLLVADPAVRNIISFLLLALAGFVLVGWVVVRSGYGRAVRAGVGCAAAAVVLLLVASLRVDGYSGELVPRFAWRWSPPADHLLEQPPAAATAEGIDLASRGADDFPEFLGPGRRLQVVGVGLQGDWQRQQPRQLWRQPIGAGWSAFSAVNGYAVTMEQRADVELVTCYELLTGELVWSHGIAGRHSNPLGGVGPRSTPTIHEGRVYALGATGVLRCLDGASGQLVWQLDLVDHYGVSPGDEQQQRPWGRAASPLIVDGLCIVPAGGPAGNNRSLAAVDVASGEIVWEAGSEPISYASPVAVTVDGQRQVWIVNESTVSGHALEDGRPLWQFDWPGSSSGNASASQAVPVGDAQVLVSKGYGEGAALYQLDRQADGSWHPRQLWHDRRVLRTKLTNVVVSGDFVYGLSDGILECVELATGARRWKRGRYGHGQILGVDDSLLLVLAENGELAMVAMTADEHRELGRTRVLDGTTWNNLCLYGRYLVVRNAEQAACFELP